MLLKVHRATLSEIYTVYTVLSGKITISDLLDIVLLVPSTCLIVFVSGTL